jgi:membrane-associated phospholipid phosphatase
VFAIVVLLGHLHYSIDVLSAYFITFSVFHLCTFLFRKDWKFFQEN